MSAPADIPAIIRKMANDLKTNMLESFRGAVERFTSDVDALSHEDLDKVWGDDSRRAYDFIYEVAFLHRNAAKRLRGEEPVPMPGKFGAEWLTASDELRDKKAAMQFFNETAQALMEAARASTDPLISEEGEPTRLFESLRFAALHTSYHDAQLNFIQTLKGDRSVHWNLG